MHKLGWRTSHTIDKSLPVGEILISNKNYTSITGVDGNSQQVLGAIGLSISYLGTTTVSSKGPDVVNAMKRLGGLAGELVYPSIEVMRGKCSELFCDSSRGMPSPRSRFEKLREESSESRRSGACNSARARHIRVAINAALRLGSARPSVLFEPTCGMCKRQSISHKAPAA